MSKIWIVDAFTEKPFQGNPAAVMLVDAFFTDEMCQAIASEMNLSETAFVKPIKENHFHLRWFTPKVEVKLCGHATLASAHILFEEGIVKDKSIVFDSLSGPLQVSRQKDGIQLDFPLQKTGPQLNAQLFEMLEFGSSMIQVVKAYDDIIIELDDEKSVNEYQPDFHVLSQLDARGIIITARAKAFDFVSRFFAPRVGVNEDPVTGSAHCKLAHYWSHKFGKQDMVAYQASARGGKLSIKVVGDRVYLTGHAVTMLSGIWRK